MYEHLLVALDGSAAAERVLPHAEAIAEAFNATITLVRAVISAEMFFAETATGDTGVGQVAPPVDPTPILEADRSAAVDYLDNVARRLAARHSLHIADRLARVTCVAAFDGVAQGAGEPRQTRDLVAIRHHLQQQVIHIHPASGRRDGFGHRLVERLRGDVAHTSFGILRADVRHGL